MRERGAPRGIRCWVWPCHMGAVLAQHVGLLPASPPPPGRLPGKPPEHLSTSSNYGAGRITGKAIHTTI